MYGPLIELAIFGIVAFLIINKLLSSLGNTNEEDSKNRPSFFGENDTIKDVTARSTVKDVTTNHNNITPVDLKEIILKDHEQEIQQGLQEAITKIPNLNIRKFLLSAKNAFKMILTAVVKNDEAQINELVDKRYISEFLQTASNYIDNSSNDSVQAQISEIYTFGNNVFIKILFIGKNIIKNSDNFHEEWTFSKNSLDPNPNWYLTNIDKSN
ncbi:MAG: hypothetical protein H6909_04725 [Rickettsiaceae bacterium]|nr:hypothetical protein [Rickettsiaceae bacterium]